MSKVSVTGSKAVMSEVIETMHGLNLVHITDYDGSWEGFEPGDPLPGSDETSSTLVTVRSIESILDLDENDVGTGLSADLSDAEQRLEETRTAVNELEDTRDELRNRMRDIDDQLDRMTLFASLGIDLDLLWGYSSLDVLVGEGPKAEIETTLETSEAVDAFEVFGASDTVAVFAYMADDERLEDALVGVPFTAYEVPEEEGNPEAIVERLSRERKQAEAKLEKTKSELEALKAETGAFLLALEEELSIEAQKYEAPLRFATTKRSFIAEGWIPTDEFDRLESTLRTDVGDRVEIDEIERAQFTSGGHVHRETHGEGGHGGDDHASAETATDGGPQAATDGGQSVATDGGTSTAQTNGGREVVTVKDDPPVIQKNSRVANPFEVLVKAVNRPKYSEFDPTLLVFLTFPFFFGFMIGDVGYGLLYVLIGYAVYAKFESPGVRDFGLVVVWLGIFTVIFGVLYGEVFGHYVFQWLWEPILGSGEYQLFPKGLTNQDWAITWLIVALFFGWFQLNIGYLINFIEEFQIHGAKEALIESGSWLLMLNGIWLWIFSTHVAGPKPAFLVGEDALLNETTFALGFTGFPAEVGIIGLVMFALGIALILSGPWFEVFEFLVPVVHVISYTRLTAVLLSKAGMAVAANLLYFGAYGEDGFNFMVTSMPADNQDVVFNGLYNMGTEMTVGPLAFGLEGALLGIPVLIVGHIVVLAIGGTAALQAIRLEYVEFFEKFYEGGGKNYEPFGYDRNHSED